LDKDEVEKLLAALAENPAERVAQKRLAYEATKIVHGEKQADNVVKITTVLFGGGKVADLSQDELNQLALSIPTARVKESLVDILAESGLANSKSEARKTLAAGAVTVNGEKVLEDCEVGRLSLVKKGKNKFVLVR
jgi:tyrosyl-tRNA synthetase